MISSVRLAKCWASSSVPKVFFLNEVPRCAVPTIQILALSIPMSRMPRCGVVQLISSMRIVSSWIKYPNMFSSSESPCSPRCSTIVPKNLASGPAQQSSAACSPFVPPATWAAWRCLRAPSLSELGNKPDILSKW